MKIKGVMFGVNEGGEILEGVAGTSQNNEGYRSQEFGDNGSSCILPGLPNDLACLCLACIPLWQHGTLKTVCKAWNGVFSGKSLFETRKRWGKCEELLCLFRDDPSITQGELFDPRSQSWTLLPPMPSDPFTYGLTNFECVSIGTGLLVIGGSLYDARSFPMDRPLPSSAVYRYDSSCSRWDRLPDMHTPRGSFACGVFEDCSVLVAGGGCRHAQFSAGGSRLSSVEIYNALENRWSRINGLHNIRAGCVGFVLGDEFWVMGGYGDSRTIAGILPVDEYYSDGEVMNLKTGSWRPLMPMWEDGERRRLGKVAIMRSGNGEPGTVYMLDGSAIFRYCTVYLPFHHSFLRLVRTNPLVAVSRIRIHKSVCIYPLFALVCG